MKILLAVDGSGFTKKMLAYLTTHDEWLSPKNSYTLISVQLPLPPRARAAVGADMAASFYADESQKVTAPVVKFLKRHGIEAEVVHKVGAPGDLIAKTADSGKFDLLMMGSHGHSALGGLVLGSVTTKVLANCKVPVLLVR